jgi:hypothetical protein
MGGDWRAKNQIILELWLKLHSNNNLPTKQSSKKIVYKLCPTLHIG